MPTSLPFFGDDLARQAFDAAVQRMRELGGEVVPVDYAPLAQAAALGLCARDDLWKQLHGTPDLFMDAAEKTLGDNPGIWAAHPRSVDFQYNLLAPHGQKMLQGSPVADELKAYADEVDKSLAA